MGNKREIKYFSVYAIGTIVNNNVEFHGGMLLNNVTIFMTDDVSRC